jgi:hypothetical protein
MGFVKNLILGIAIAIIFSLFIGFGIQAFYKSPEYNTFCANVTDMIPADRCPVQPTYAPYDKYPTNCWCDQDCKANGTCVNTNVCHTTNPEYTACQQNFEKANKHYNRNVFIMTSIIGLITMLVSAFILLHESVSPGLMGGGFITIVYGTIRYWSFAGDKLRFTILGIILAMLIYFAYTKWPGAKKPAKEKHKK